MTVLRSVAYRVFLLGLSIVMGIAAFPVRLFAPRLAMPYAKLWSRLLLDGARRICGIRLRVVGLERLPLDRPFIIASQHQSAFDTLVWMTLVPQPTYVMKQELLKVPLVGPMLKLTGMIPVARDAGSKAMRTLMRATEAAAGEGRQLIIFPEGTRVAPGQREPLKPGIVVMARQTGLPVYPVVTDSGRFWPNHGFRKYPGMISIVIGEPVEGKSRAEMLGAIETAWRAGEARLPVA